MTERDATTPAPLPPLSRGEISAQQATRFIFNLGERMGQPMPLSLLACHLEPDLRPPETLRELESMLISQFSVMDGAFHFLTEGRMHPETLKLALQAQRQCRNTFATLARVSKSPSAPLPLTPLDPSAS
ncbi:MAG: hypothetical protein WC043_06415 [Pseudobdellovibrionaceae bacterium]